MESFEQLAHQYQPMIHKIIRSLNIYKNVDEFYQIGFITLWDTQKCFNEEKSSFTSLAYTSIKGRILNEMAKDKTNAARMIYPEEEDWEMTADTHDDQSFEEEFLRTHGQSLTEKETKWLIKACFTRLSVKKLPKAKTYREYKGEYKGTVLVSHE
ncbi:sigma-70 family RNA polymerase sigma factor [Bacillus sp. EB600]|uniref:sigma-70 family RNA polymerase sigma factor n=1 Tax=Bacillus sp. EB600 TaxID=2806345 RepID=UPI00210ED12A|nr:sigma-70 family RNA polymerase sigma factor [Bacillus sp. EB600]MCQ6278507.1 sigma-70 family RNA polymerase sigma factor [Bacillus sp. EB600]